MRGERGFGVLKMYKSDCQLAVRNIPPSHGFPARHGRSSPDIYSFAQSYTECKCRRQLLKFHRVRLKRRGGGGERRRKLDLYPLYRYIVQNVHFLSRKQNFFFLSSIRTNYYPAHLSYLSHERKRKGIKIGGNWSDLRLERFG